MADEKQCLMEVIFGPTSTGDAEQMAEEVHKWFDERRPDLGAAVSVTFDFELVEAEEKRREERLDAIGVLLNEAMERAEAARDKALQLIRSL